MTPSATRTSASRGPAAAAVADGSTGSSRLPALDGLRGIAAVVVVVHHLLLVVPAVSALVDVDGTGPEADAAPWSAGWWLLHTPLRLVWAGGEAVLLFFVLSGLVLTLPVLRGWGRREWRAYYPRRLVRLYLPVWASVVLALGLALLVSRDTGADSGWLAIHRPPSLRALVYDTTLLYDTSNLNSPLWSLRWEIWFSLLLPVGVGLALLLRTARWWPVAIVVLAAASASAQVPAVAAALPASDVLRGLLVHMPVFGIGIVLASALPHVRLLLARIDRSPRSGRRWAFLATAALLSTTAPAVVDAGSTPVVLGVVLRTLGLLGVTGLVMLALGWPALQRRLGARPVQWLGTRSFSLYLVHEPLLVAAALLLGGPSVAVWGLVGLPLVVVVLVVTEVFHRVVERPSQRLARTFGPGRDTRVLAEP